jgi:hypothetical protein
VCVVGVVCICVRMGICLYSISICMHVCIVYSDDHCQVFYSRRRLADGGGDSMVHVIVTTIYTIYVVYMHGNVAGA